MTEREKYFYQQGYDRGVSIASWVDIPEPGSEIPGDLDPIGSEVVDTPEAAMDVMYLLAGESEQIDREYSPFEFTAGEINRYEKWCEDHGKFPGGWEAFDQGIEDGISSELQDRYPAVRATFDDYEKKDSL